MTTTTAEKIAIMQAYLDGKQIQYAPHGSERWRQINIYSKEKDDLAWDWSVFEYRIEEKKKPSINWAEVNKQYKYIIRQSNGECTMYINKPSIYIPTEDSDGFWHVEVPVSEERSFNPFMFSSFDPGNCDWKDSLVERPSHI